MKKIFSLQLCVWLFLTILFSQCTKVDLEEGVRKTTILRHNYIAITTKDDIPGEVEVHYSILGNNGQNEVKTPFHTNIAANRKYIHLSLIHI